VSYNASAVKIYKATSSLVGLEKNSSALKNALAYYNAGVVIGYSVVGFDPEPGL
jgi:hypothetical protein